MGTLTFAQRNETFGFDTGTSWASDALSILMAVPRVFHPLMHAWDYRYPGTRRAVEKLVALGMVDYQAPVVIDVRTGRPVGRASVPVPRFRATAAGKRLAKDAMEDSRTLHDVFPRVTDSASAKLAVLLDAFSLESPHSRLGMSVSHATMLSGMPERSARWWVRHLQQAGYLAELPDKLADVREVIPGHWRPNRLLCRQLSHVIDAFPKTAPASMRSLYRLNRSRFLTDIDPSRVGLTGATDYDHDVETQRILAAFLRSARCAYSGVFAVEPRISLRVDTTSIPWRFGGTEAVFYQPDAEIREWDAQGALRRSIVEYERFQSRRDAWSHIERFLGWLGETNNTGEPAILRFVVDSEPRIRSYVDLIEAFADYLIDYPERRPRGTTLLAVSSVGRVLNTSEPLDDRQWFRIELPKRGSDTAPVPVLHGKQSPYDDYFARGA